MSRERMLLDRLAHLGREPGGARKRVSEDVDLLLASVQRHLFRLLNSRIGMSEAVPDYGLPPLTDTGYNTGEAERMLLESIRVAVESFEPRLKRVKVSRVMENNRPQRMSFRIDAALLTQAGEQKIWYQTQLGGTGRFELSD